MPQPHDLIVHRPNPLSAACSCGGWHFGAPHRYGVDPAALREEAARAHAAHVLLHRHHLDRRHPGGVTRSGHRP